MNELQLLRVLQDNPRIDTRDLADIMNVSEQRVTEEVARLEKKQVICGYHTVVNWDKTEVDHCSAIIEVSAKPERDVGYDRIAQGIAKFDEVSSLYLMSGKSEFIVIIEGKSMREIADFVAQKLAPLDGVISTVTCFVLKPYKIEGAVIDKEENESQRLIVTP